MILSLITLSFNSIWIPVILSLIPIIILFIPYRPTSMFDMGGALQALFALIGLGLIWLVYFGIMYFNK